MGINLNIPHLADLFPFGTQRKRANTEQNRAEQLNFNYTLTSAVNINRNNSSEKSRNNCVVTRPKYLNQIFFKAAYTQKQSICVFLANKLKCFFLYVFHMDIVEIDKRQKNVFQFFLSLSLFNQTSATLDCGNFCLWARILSRTLNELLIWL